MFEFLGLGRKKAKKSVPDHGPITAPQTVHLSATQLEVVRMTLHGVLKLNGIPGEWISGEVIPIHLPGQGEALLLQLEVTHWHDALVLHAPAFQQALMEGLHRFDPKAGSTRYLFSWKFSPNCGCPHVHLPAPEYWLSSERVVLTPTVAPPGTAAPLVAASPSTIPSIPAPSRNAVDFPVDDDDDDHGFPRTYMRGER